MNPNFFYYSLLAGSLGAVDQGHLRFRTMLYEFARTKLREVIDQRSEETSCPEGQEHTLALESAIEQLEKDFEHGINPQESVLASSDDDTNFASDDDPIKLQLAALLSPTELKRTLVVNSYEPAIPISFLKLLASGVPAEVLQPESTAGRSRKSRRRLTTWTIQMVTAAAIGVAIFAVIDGKTATFDLIGSFKLGETKDVQSTNTISEQGNSRIESTEQAVVPAWSGISDPAPSAPTQPTSSASDAIQLNPTTSRGQGRNAPIQTASGRAKPQIQKTIASAPMGSSASSSAKSAATRPDVRFQTGSSAPQSTIPIPTASGAGKPKIGSAAERIDLAFALPTISSAARSNSSAQSASSGATPPAERIEPGSAITAISSAVPNIPVRVASSTPQLKILVPTAFGVTQPNILAPSTSDGTTPNTAISTVTGMAERSTLAALRPIEPNIPIPTARGVYALRNGQLTELDLLPITVPDSRVAVSSPITTSTRTHLSDGHLQFVIFRRDLVSSAAKSLAVRVVARVARISTFDPTGKTISTDIDGLWVVRDSSYQMRVTQVADNPELIEIRPENLDLIFPPGRYALVLNNAGFDFAIDGPESDNAHCLESTYALKGPIYTECGKP